jgi:hypothetical protein
MKNVLFLLFALFLTKACFGQAGTSLSIRNNSSTCDGYCKVIMSTATSSSAACTTGFNSSNMITIPAGSTITYTTSSLPSGVSGNYFVGVQIYSGPASCSPISTTIGESCASLNNTASLNSVTAACATCAHLNYTWQDASVVGTRAFLSITPL